MIEKLAAVLPGWQPLIVCQGTANDPCNYEKLVILAKVLIHDMVVISTFLAIVTFAYAGLKMLMANGNEGEFSKAVNMLKNVAFGYMWILAAWFIVYTITSVLLNPGFSLLSSPR